MSKRILACVCATLGLFGLLGDALAGSGVTVPELTVYRRDLPESEALAFVQQLKIGWNLGNTFDAYDNSFKGNDLEMEKHWVGVYTSEAVIQALKDAGFNAIRIPVSWHNHVSDDYIVNEAWMNRVQEVADWAIERDMYVILNTHHDVDFKYYYPSSEHYDNSAAYLGSVWSQMAERFKDYDEHLILESMNEPRLANTANEWYFNPAVPACMDSMECINKLNQLFVDTVRAAGGCNETRYLMVSSYDASVQSALSPYFKLPQDSAENRLIVSTHAYTPYSFALEDGGTDAFSLTQNGPQVRELVVMFDGLYDTYIKNGIPVVMGEFGARDKKNNLQARVDFCAEYIALASARGIPCFWWDNHAFKGSGELFGILNRKNATWEYPEIVEALMKYAGWENLPASNG